MATTIEQVVNQALVSAGVLYRVGDIFEGSPEAKVALELFGQARDEIIRLNNWSFARRQAGLTLLKGPPPNGGYSPLQPWSAIYPAQGFLFEYAYPSDCLDLGDILAQPGSMPDLDPVPELWTVANDLTPNVSGNPPAASGPAAKVILCNVNQAMAVYKAQVTDPNDWDAGFVLALVESLGKKFAEAFGAGPNEVREQRAEAVMVKEAAEDVRG